MAVFFPIFERIQNHYTKEENVSAPYSSQVVKMKRPEGHSNDYVGHEPHPLKAYQSK